MREARDVATSTTRLALSQSTRSRTNRVWHWRTLRRCRRGMIRMIQAAAHPRTPASIPLLPRPTRTRPGTRLQTLRLPSPRTRTNRTRILRPSERVSQLQAAGGGGGRRAAAGDGGRQGPPLLRPGLPRTCGDRRIREVTPAGFIIRHIYHGSSMMVLPNQHSPPPPDHLRTTLHYSASPPQNRPCDRPISTAG